MRVCVLGAGIVGLASAYALSGAGHEVSVIDRALPGGGASGGNGSQLSYSYVQPLADPGIWAQLPKLLLSPTSPLKFRPQLDPHQWLWGLRFLVACNAATSRATTIELLQLALESRQAFDAMMAREQLDCDFSSTGKLVLLSSPASFAAARQQMLLQRALGSTQEAVSADRCVALEPALQHQHRHIAGAVSHAHVGCRVRWPIDLDRDAVALKRVNRQRHAQRSCHGGRRRAQRHHVVIGLDGPFRGADRQH